MGMELFHYRQRNAKQMLNGISHGDIIGQSDFVSDGFKFPASDKWHQFHSQRLTQAKTRSTGSKPEFDRLLQRKKLKCIQDLGLDRLHNLMLYYTNLVLAWGQIIIFQTKNITEQIKYCMSFWHLYTTIIYIHLYHKYQDRLHA